MTTNPRKLSLKERLFFRLVRYVCQSEGQLLVGLKLLNKKYQAEELSQLLRNEIAEVEKQLDLTSKIQEQIPDVDDEYQEIIKVILSDLLQIVDLNENERIEAQFVIAFLRSALFYQVAQYEVALYCTEKFGLLGIRNMLAECLREKEQSIRRLSTFEVSGNRIDVTTPGFVYLPPP